MMGRILVFFAFSTGLATVVLFYLSSRPNNNRFLAYARGAYHAAAISVLTVSAFLLYLILTHHFQFTYVWNYSSTDLPTPLLLSTFYAGQEGSFTLWALFTAIVGIFLMRYTGRRRFEAEVMFVWSLILSFLLLMLVVKNPFEMIWDAFPADLIKSGPVPPGLPNVVMLDQVKNIWAHYPVEGRGLNPLLQNYWMVIHPQILFMGFTSMAVPYAFAVAGLMQREYREWVRIAKPWTVFGAAVLGTGIILGGYWTYETLGWGGYWGWDPVENPDQSSVEITIGATQPPTGSGKGETLIVEASVKPYINLVWMGTITLIAGFILAIVRRIDETGDRTDDEHTLTQ